MKVFIVVNNDKIDEVFVSKRLAEERRLELQARWNIARVVEKEINDDSLYSNSRY